MSQYYRTKVNAVLCLLCLLALAIRRQSTIEERKKPLIANQSVMLHSPSGCRTHCHRNGYFRNSQNVGLVHSLAVSGCTDWQRLDESRMAFPTFLCGQTVQKVTPKEYKLWENAQKCPWKTKHPLAEGDPCVSWAAMEAPGSQCVSMCPWCPCAQLELRDVLCSCCGWDSASIHRAECWELCTGMS